MCCLKLRALTVEALEVKSSPIIELLWSSRCLALLPFDGVTSLVVDLHFDISAFSPNHCRANDAHSFSLIHILLSTVKMPEIEMPDPEDLGGNVTKPFKFVTGTFSPE